MTISNLCDAHMSNQNYIGKFFFPRKLICKNSLQIITQYNDCSIRAWYEPSSNPNLVDHI